LVNLEVDPAQLRAALRSEWSAEEDFGAIPGDRINRLMHERYLRAAWHEKF
jgi:hypothetical protein